MGNGVQKGVDRSQFKYSKKLPDFSESAAVNSSVFQGKLNLTEKMMKEKHPMEYMVAPARAAENVYARLGETEFLLTNFPVS
mmetsp:Transcript_24320/g.37609  ORF Transcript_24320/g.37609 Transcript_24320/m.37609 type:complete len:82 (+) Transcript_24320:193-438(+)